jgi:hypothetical protein
MRTIESMPDRPLTVSDLDALAEADGVNGVITWTLRPDTRLVVIVGVAKGPDDVLVAFHPGRREWVVIDRWDGVRED